MLYYFYFRWTYNIFLLSCTNNLFAYTLVIHYNCCIGYFWHFCVYFLRLKPIAMYFLSNRFLLNKGLTKPTYFCYLYLLL